MADIHDKLVLKARPSKTMPGHVLVVIEVDGKRIHSGLYAKIGWLDGRKPKRPAKPGKVKHLLKRKE